MKAVVIHAAHDLRVESRETKDLPDGMVRVAVEFGGICGSDLHYYHDGGFGIVQLREPMILGHEVSGKIAEVGAGVTGLNVGDRVAVSPSRACKTCQFCQAGEPIHCLNMRFYGSALPMPHIQGAFREELIADPEQCYVINPETPGELGAFAEPLAVVIHALNRAPDLKGKSVLITGAGPIGQLVLLAARHAGAGEIVVSDPVAETRALSKTLGADAAEDATASGWTDRYAEMKGRFDVHFECSGHFAAFADGVKVLKPRATLVQVGLGGDISIPLTAAVVKELRVQGTYRFHHEFADAVKMINDQVLDLPALLTGQYKVEDAIAAFDLAGDRTRAMKVQLDFRGA